MWYGRISSTTDPYATFINVGQQKMKLVERANAGIHAHVMRLINDVAPDKQSKILDIGCGTGAFLMRLQAGGYRSLFGSDIKTPDINASEIIYSEFDLDNGNIPYADASFAIITSIEVFEHLENLGHLLGEIARVLTQDGVFIMTTPNIHSVEARLRFLILGRMKQFDGLSDPTHISPILLYTFTRLLSRYSLEITSIGGIPGDGSSPTSRMPLRLASRVLSMFGVDGSPPGDHLCLQIKRKHESTNASPRSKQSLATDHY